MYTSPDEARSDLFLAGAVFLFGPLLLGVVLDLLPLDGIPGFGLVLAVVLPLATTLLVPWLLIRYRKERLSDYGLGVPAQTFLPGLLLAAPIVAAALLAGLLSGGDVLADVPVVAAAASGSWVQLLARLVSWVGLVGLAVYMTVKARDAFRGDPMYLRTALLQIGRIVGLVAAGATVLLVVSTLFNEVSSGSLGVIARLVLLPVAVAGAVLLATQRLRGNVLTARPTLLTPVVLLAIGPFALSLNAVSFVFGVWQAAVLAGVGLLIGSLLEARRSALGPLALGLALAVTTSL